MHNNISDTISNTIKQIATIINFNGNNVHEFDDCSNRYEAPSRLGYLINASNNADNDMVGTMEVSKDSFLYRTVDKNNIQQQDIYGKLSKGKSVHFMNTSLLGNIRIVNKTGISITNAFMILQLNKNISECLHINKLKLKQNFIILYKVFISTKLIFYKFLISSEKPIIIKINKIVFLKIVLDNLFLILVPKYCPNNAGAVIIKLSNKFILIVCIYIIIYAMK